MERFDERKIYASCYAACLSAHIPHHTAEKICGKVTIGVKKWAMKKHAVTSHDIFLKTVTLIRKHHREAAFMYTSHRDIC